MEASEFEDEISVCLLSLEFSSFFNDADDDDVISAVDDDVISAEDDVMVDEAAAEEVGTPGVFWWAESDALWVESGCGILATVSEEEDAEGAWPFRTRVEPETGFAGGS
jgi:hypothetical protein